MKQFYTVLFLVLASVTYAQNIVLKDATTKKVISGVAIFNESKSKSEVSNLNGVINLDEFNSDELLIVKHISYHEMLLYKTQFTNNEFYLKSNLQDLDEIVLSASKFSQTKKEISKTIATVDAKLVGFTNPQTSADALQKTGKVFIQKSQLGGGSPIIRGFSTNRLLLTVDGVRMNNAIFRSGNLQNVISIDPFSIKNTEVTLGAGAVIYGSDAIGGVMSFNTKKPKLSYQDSLIINSSSTIRYASANQEQTVNANVNLGFKKWGFLSHFTYTSFNDLRMGKNGPDDYLRPEFVVTLGNRDVVVKNKTPKVQRETGYNQINFMQKALFSPNNNLDVKLGLFYTKTGYVPRYDRLTRYKNNQLRSAEWFYGPQQWLMAHLSTDYKNSNNWLYNSAKVNLAFQKFNESRVDRDFQDIIRNTRQEFVNAYNVSLDFEKIFSSKINLFYGVDYVFNQVKSEAYQENINTSARESIVTRYPNGSTWQSAAAYFNLKYKPTKTVVLQSGMRYSNVLSKANFDANNQFLSLPFNSSKTNNNAFTGALGVAWTPNKMINWRLNLSSAFRAPNIDDIGKVFDSEPGSVVIPNDNLKPEYAYGLELGLGLNFENIVELDLATYYTFLDDALIRRETTLNGQSQILYDGELSSVQSIQNASEAKIYGFEIGTKVNLTSQLYSKSQLNIVGGKEISNSIESPSRHISPQFGNSHFVWDNKKIKVDGFVQFNGSLSNNQLANSEQSKTYIYALDTNGNPFAPSWYTLNLTSQYKLNTNTTITASLENITDQRYRTYSSGITAPGRNLIVSLSYKL